MNKEESGFLHSLKQPLATAHGQLALLQRRFDADLVGLPPEVIEKIKKAFEALDRLAKMINARQEQLEAADTTHKV